MHYHSQWHRKLLNLGGGGGGTKREQRVAVIDV